MSLPFHSAASFLLVLCLIQEAWSSILPAVAQTEVSRVMSRPVGETEHNLLTLYTANDLSPFWVGYHGPTSQAETLFRVLAQSSVDGLEPQDYFAAEIQSIWGSLRTEDLARLEVLLTLGLGRYLSDMHRGRTAFCRVDNQHYVTARVSEQAISSLIRQTVSMSNNELADFLKGQAPSHIGYTLLRDALARYRRLAAEGGWQPIPSGATIHPGMSDPRLPSIARRLHRTGDLQTLDIDLSLYAEPLAAAVQRFQKRFGLKPDGIIGRNTLASMNLPVEVLITRILINMERWRWLPHTLDGKHLLVNVAGFQLEGLSDEKVIISMPVIVGKVYHETPVFSDLMRYIVVNPFWTIPPDIAQQETLPNQIEDPDYLRDNRIRVFDGWEDGAAEIAPESVDWSTLGQGIRRFRLRQDPGPDNALGTMKFMFPNSYNVYLHDTPAQELFAYTSRMFSHGCIRVSDPRGLAGFVLEDNTSPVTEQVLSALVADGKRKVIPLAEPVPVHILYRTVFVDPQSSAVHFFKDVYKRDAKLARSLFDAPPPELCLER